jgi:hypothetical protein
MVSVNLTGAVSPQHSAAEPPPPLPLPLHRAPSPTRPSKPSAAASVLGGLVPRNSTSETPREMVATLRGRSSIANGESSEANHPDSPAPQQTRAQSGLLGMPTEIIRHIASQADPDSVVNLADATLALNRKLRNERLDSVVAIVKRDISSLKTAEGAKAVLQRIAELPPHMQGEHLATLGTHILLHLPKSSSRNAALRVFVDAGRAYTQEPSTDLIKTFVRAADNPGGHDYLFRDALDLVEHDGLTAQQAIRRHDIQGQLERAMLQAAEFDVSKNGRSQLGHGTTRFQALR